MPSAGPDGTDDDVVELVVAGDAGVDAVLDVLGALWAARPGEVPDQDRFCFETAVAEVVGNAVRHGGGDATTVRAAVVRDTGGHATALRADVVDHGPPIDLAAYVDLPDDDAESGRGLALARRAVTTLACDRAGDANHWLVVRRVGG
nr:ATP-binding protein [uncultured Actinotalea sp.]